MKQLLILVGLFICSISFAFGQDEAQAYQQAEKEINAIYQKILKEYRADTEFVANLKASQRLWIQFRDAEIRARYPKRTPGYYGNVLSLCVTNLKTQLTNDRIKALKVWLEGIQDGDVCAGSVKRR